MDGVRRSAGVLPLMALLAVAMWLTATPASAAVIGMELASVGSYGGTDGDSSSARVSADGRFIVFESSASRLAVGDYSNGPDVFIRDRTLKTTALVSRGAGGALPLGPSHTPAISADGACVVFVSLASNLTTGTLAGPGTYRWSRLTGVIERVDVAPGQVPGTWNTAQAGVWWYPSISGDGRYIAFTTGDPGLTGGTGQLQVCRRDMIDGTVDRVNVSSSGAPSPEMCRYPSISDDGMRVSFNSFSSLVPTDTNPVPDIYVRDLGADTTMWASAPAPGVVGASGAAKWSAISGDGKVVAFTSAASNLVSTDTHGAENVFARVLASATTELVSIGASGVATSRCFNPALSRDGRIVSFQSDADNLLVRATEPTHPYYSVFVRDRGTRVTTALGMQLTQVALYGSSTSLSADGRYVVFDAAPESATPYPLMDSDTNGARDVFVYDLHPQVRAVLSAPRPSLSIPRHNVYFYLSGTVTRHPGARAKVQLKLYRWVKSLGRYSKTPYKTYTVYTATGSTAYKYKLRLPYTGKWYVRAYHPADAGHVLSWSSIRYFAVRT